MSLLNTQSKTRFWPLRGDSGEAPAWSASTAIDFNLGNIPKLTQGRFANYLPAIALTAFGTYTTDIPDATERVTWSDLAQGLYQSFDLQGAWHGRPLANQHMRGATARIWELISMGYQSGSRHVAGQRASTVAVPFRHTLYLPLCHALGPNGARYTSQLSILYKNATLYINTTANAVDIFHGDSEAVGQLTIVGANIRASAVLLPEPCIRIAPGVEWLEYQTKGAVASSDGVDLESLGNATALEGVEPGAGIDTMLALTNMDGLLGSFQLDALTQFSAPFLDQSQTRHLDPFINMLEQVSAKGERPREQQVEDIAAGVPGALGYVIDASGFPNIDQRMAGPVNGAGGATLNFNGLVFPLIVSGPELELTKIQRFEGTQTYNRTVDDVTGSIDRTLLHQYKSWTPAKHEDFRQLVIAEGLAAAVLGTKEISPMAVRNEVGKPMEPSRGRFFPVEWVKDGDPEKKAA